MVIDMNDNLEVNKIPTPYCLIKIEDGISMPVFLSDEAIDLVGYDLESFSEIYARNPETIFCGTDFKKAKDAFDFADSHPGMKFDFDGEIIKASSMPITLNFWGETVRDGENTLYRYVFFKESNNGAGKVDYEEYLYSLRLYDALMESSDIGIIRFDVGNEIKVNWCNEAALRMIKCSRFEYIRDYSGDLKKFFAGNMDEFNRISNEIISAKSSGLKKFDITARLLPKGKSVWLQGTMTFIDGKSMAENEASIYFAFTDITSSVEKNEELAAAKLAADAANSAKSDFLSRMSHDIRTPLNGIIGFTDLAIKEENNAKKDEYLGKIRTSGKLLSELVDDILELSRIESGKMTLDREAVDGVELGALVINAVSQEAESRGIRLNADTATYPNETVLVDKLKFQKIMLNLLSNAIKYTEPGGTVSMTVSILDPPVEGRNRRIVVEDTGIGMNREFLDKIFEPFTQENRPEANHVQGTGLGLSIVKKIVDRMEGQITVESEIGKGSKFTVDLPVEVVEKSSYSQKKNTVSATVDFTGVRILLCEDNELNREIATVLLEERGIELHSAKDGAEGVKLFSESESGYYDMILMDIRMPVMDGFEAISAIRNMNRDDAKVIPVIAMTADAFSENITKSESYGMNGYITKPIDPILMFKTISEHIKKR